MSAESPFESLGAFVASPVGKVVLGVGLIALIGGAGAVAGLLERLHPTVHVANVFSAPLQVRTGSQTVVVPAHGAAQLKLEDAESILRVYSGETEIDGFSPPFKNHDVLNILGAAPIVRQKVRWSPSKEKPGIMVGDPLPASGNYCGTRIIHAKMANDILRGGPDEIYVKKNAATTTMRERLYVAPDASAYECLPQLEVQKRTDDIARIRKLASDLGEAEPENE